MACIHTPYTHELQEEYIQFLQRFLSTVSICPYLFLDPFSHVNEGLCIPDSVLSFMLRTCFKSLAGGP
jgi:hypothetical protein